MAETLSKEQRQEYMEEREHFEKNNPPARKKEHRREPDYEQERAVHEKNESRRRETVSASEREEMAEEVEYHEKHHQQPRGKTQKRGPEPDYEAKDPGHGRMNILSPMEISAYREEIGYQEKLHPTKKAPVRESASILGAWEMGFINHGEEKRGKKMPMGMAGYDLELGHHDHTHSRAESTGERLNRYGRMVGGIRDDLYGYRTYNSRNYEYVGEIGSLGYEEQQKNIRKKKLRHSDIGNINFFGRVGNPFATMDPFGVGRGGGGRARKSKGGGKGRGRSYMDDPFALPSSISWMF